MVARFPITKDGFTKMQAELSNLKDEKPKIITAIAEARQQGDLSENAEYSSARERQSFIEGRITYLENNLLRAEIIDVQLLSGETIMFGATVTLLMFHDSESEKEENSTIYIYKIVSEYEADISNRMISIQSPLASALIGKKAAEYIELTTPKGENRLYKIINVEFK